MLPQLSPLRASGRLISAWLAVFAASLVLPGPAFARDQPSGTATPDEGATGTLIGSISGGRHTAETAVFAPEVSGAFLSLAMPGAGQLYAGNPVKAAVYLGAAVLVGAGTYNLLRSGLSEFEAKEARTQAFMGVIAYGTSFVVGVASTLDAIADITGRHQAASDTLEPLAGTEVRPRPAPSRRRPED